ncbi:cellulase family glycosylhydrolase [Pedobacter vanadiisoli]|uniref:Cellulase family glycosylhydrolase n=1 Tax=Pedobacter vanadiisoli TaxID=1761975 RepID=A0ABW5MS00_9SPHI
MKIIKTQNIYKVLGVFLGILLVTSCKKSQTESAQLTLSNITQAISEEGGTVGLSFTSDAEWSATKEGAEWLSLSQTSGGSGAGTINLTASSNSTGASRSVVLIINSTNGQRRRITVTQNAKIYPSYNISPKAADAVGMNSTAMELCNKMTMGWNIYNTLDAPGWETGWGQPPVTQQLIDLVKSTGMNAVRIPVTWSNHIINKQTQEIDPLWLARVKEVVQYCFNAKMYVILNTHHDGYIDCKVTGAKQDTVNAKHKAIWQQIATTMRDFDEHLIFASANEPEATTDQETATLMRYHQSFINAVRSTGGKNAYRALVLQAPNTSLTLMNEQLNPANVYKRATLPSDAVPQKMILEFHYYSPPNFCIISEDATWGKAWYFWGAGFHTKNPLFLDRNSSPASEEASVNAAMRSVKTNFTDKGIPVIMGEYDVSYHADKLKGYPADSLLALKSGWHFYAHVTKQAKVNGIVPFLWASGIFQRPFKNGVAAPAYIGDQVALDSLKKGAGF